MSLKYREIFAENQKLKNSMQGKEYPVAIISNIIVNQLKEIFEYTLRRTGINANCTIGNYNNIVQDSKRMNNNKLVVIFWELANIIDGLQYKADLMSKESLSELIKNVKNELDFVFNNLKDTSNVIINTFSSLLFNVHNLDVNNLDTIADELNKYLFTKSPPNFTLINTDKIIAQISVEKSVDMRYYYSSKALYSIEFYKSWSKFVLPLLRSLNGKAKKALIFDCDNTLWKGVLGEDGFDNILLSATQSGGTPFEEVQSLAKQLNREGIIIGLCSKNNPEDVNEVLAKHPKMTLKEEDFTIKKVNWIDKVSNLKSIASTLNIGMDSLVFVDDSNFEIHFVNETLPEITTIQVPETISDYPGIIRKNLGLFYNASKTVEDLKRVKMYKQQVKREEAKVGFDNLESYIKSLKIALDVYVDELKIVPRMSQMTQKTNQFNLTTKRYSEADIKKFVELPDYTVVAIGVHDKYGDNGITGLVILRQNETNAEIDTFLMSCRIIGRNIEHRYFDYLIDLLKERGIKKLKASYIKTLKNIQVNDFYNKLGFTLINKEKDKKNYELELDNYKSSFINYIEINHGR
jgi:FkbH-like protein